MDRPTTLRSYRSVAILSSTLALLVVCSLAWAGFDLLRKLLTPHLSPLVQVFYLTLGLVPLLGLWAWRSPGQPPNGLYLIVGAATIALNVVANVSYVKALEVSDLSLSVPLLSLTPAVAALFARLLLDEHLAPLQILGILLVVAGALLLTVEHAPTRSFRSWLRALRGDRGSAYMLVVASCWALTLPLDKVAVTIVGPARHAVILTTGITLAIFGVLVVRGRVGRILEPGRAALPVLAAALVVSALALGLQLVLLERLEVGVIEGTKRAIGNVMALAFGALIYRESVTWIKAAALATMAIGVFLVLG